MGRSIGLFLTGLIAAGLSIAVTPRAHADSPSIGIMTSAVGVAGREEPIDVTLWYPAAPGGRLEDVGASKVFEGVEAWRDAPVMAGRFRLVVMAFGGLRSNPYVGDWIAADLARHGYVVAVAHPPKLGPHAARRAVEEIWRRPADLSAALTAVRKDRRLAARLSPDKASAIGFFLGGTSVLELAGARIDLGLFRISCDAPKKGPDCSWYEANGVDLHTFSLDSVAKPHPDPRIGAIVAVDPELSESLAPDSLATISVPAEIISLGGGGHGTTASADLVREIRRARASTVPAASPFSAFAICKQGAAALLMKGGGESGLCNEDHEVREAFHARIASTIIDFLARNGRR